MIDLTGLPVIQIRPCHHIGIIDIRKNSLDLPGICVIRHQTDVELASIIIQKIPGLEEDIVADALQPIDLWALPTRRVQSLRCVASDFLPVQASGLVFLPIIIDIASVQDEIRSPDHCSFSRAVTVFRGITV